LVKAYRIQEKAAQVGFDWETPDQVWSKINEELAEFKTELNKTNNKEKTEKEFGDLLFALVNLARKNGINPDDALEYTNQKFRNRFMFIEERAKEINKKMTDMSLDEMDAIWNESKSSFR
jgi:XTP/dITP diphosphohydrolase